MRLFKRVGWWGRPWLAGGAGWRRWVGLMGLVCLGDIHAGAAAQPQDVVMNVQQHDGKAYVTASALEREAGVVVKPLPGQEAVVVCRADRCAMIRDFVGQGPEALIAVEALAQALAATPTLGFPEGKVRLRFSTEAAPVTVGQVQVGQLAPDFRLIKLDGSPVALSDFRGRRVLINSWASW